jgi:hypothetical protein
MRLDRMCDWRIRYRQVARFDSPPTARVRIQAGVSVLEYTLKLRLTAPDAAARRRARKEGWRRIASLRSRA